MSIKSLLERVSSGDRKALARSISLLEDELLSTADLIAIKVNRPERAKVVGITGPPGGGKSTLVGTMLTEFSSRGRQVGVIAIDPSSPFSGGAVLGDRVRMGAHQDQGIFIRSVASRGILGGLSSSTEGIIELMNLAGFDLIVVETVGAGQSELDIVRYSDVRIVLFPPGLGDGIQAMKAGIMEIADSLVVTKADLASARETEAQLRATLRLQRAKREEIPVFPVSALSGEGVRKLCDWIDSFQRKLVSKRSSPSDRTLELVENLLRRDDFARHLNIELVSVALGSVTLRMNVESVHMNFNRSCHGGALFSLADMALGLAANSQGIAATLITSQMSFSEAVKAGDQLVAIASEVNRSRRIGTYQVSLTRIQDRKHIGLLNGTVYFLNRTQ